MADITELIRVDGKLYLAGNVGIHDYGIAGWSMGERQTTDLVVNVLVMVNRLGCCAGSRMLWVW